MPVTSGSYYSYSQKRARSVIPMKDRSPFVPQYLGGSFGYRGGNWEGARREALKKSNYYSSITGFPSSFDTLIVDHIYPYRIGGSSNPSNLRVTNLRDNFAVDNIVGFDPLLKRRGR